MAKKQEVQVELELEDDKKAKDTNGEAEVIVSDSEPEKKVAEESDTDKKIKELQEQIEKERADRKSASERADRLEKEKTEATAKAEKAEGRAASSQKESIINALAASEEALVVHRAAYKAALESSDSQAVVDAQEKLAEAKYLNSELKKNKIGFEQWEKQQEEIAKQPKNTMTQETQSWIDRNPRFNTDQEFKTEATSAHYAAINRGIRADSPAYFEFIDKRIAKVLGSTENQEDEVVVEPKKTAKEPSYSAPPNRGGGGDRETSPNGKKQYRLTAEQAEAADFMNMTTVQYAEYLEAEKKRK